jgi:hypothetical protein
MSFLQPLLLLGLGGLGLAALAHLLGRERPTVVRFAAVRFLPATPQAVVRRRRLRDRALLTTRMMLLAAMVLALARPVTEGQSTLAVVAEPHDAVVMLDASASMELEIDGMTSRARAAGLAIDLVRALPPGSRAALTVSAGPQASAPIVEMTADLTAIEAAIERWSTRPQLGSVTLADALPVAAAAFADGERQRAIYAIGDRSRGGVSSLPPRLGQARVIPVAVNPEVSAPPEHVGIETVALAPASELGARAVRITATLRRHAGAGDVQSSARLLIDDREVARASVTLSPDGRGTVEFTHSPDPTVVEAAASVVVELVDRPGDPFPVDDRRWRWIASRGALEVLVVDGDPSDRRAHDEVYFLTTAITSAPDAAARFTVRGLAPEQLSERIREDPSALADVGVLVLANVDAPEPATARAIDAAVRGGMGLWISTGDRVTGRDYNARFSDLLPLTMREAQDVGTAVGRKENRAEGLAPPRLDHPIFDGLGSAPALDGARTRRRFLLQPDPRRDADVALAFESGAPALITREHGSGRVALLTTSVDRDWSDVALRPGFVTLVERLVGWLGGAKTAAAPMVYEVGASVPLPRAQGEDAARAVHGPDGEVWRTDEARFEAAHSPGLYWVANVDSESVDALARFSADVAAEETPTEWTAAGVEAVEGAREVVSLTPRWRWFVVLALLGLIAESVIRLRRLSRARA